MFLKSIEMQGFKSFADKTKVEFDRGVTAVVGPNGSGKSNITESLRWALGESSAKSLRGGKMPDVIFAGTQNRKPLNYAQVTVLLDNSDHFIKDSGKDIRIERHIYRNGDSEYLIDGKKVRLRDVHDLFMDTGLGRDSFSIISQGRVEAIFNSKPEERRAIFEEAAGVLKYKTRKKETESKLSQTQDNLDRLDDIIYELDNQIKPLEKQAQTAKRFLVFEEERTALQLDVLVDDIQTFRAKWQEKEEDLAQTQKDLSAYYAKRQELETDNYQLKSKRQQLTDEVSRTQQDLLNITRLIADLERQIDILALESSQKEEKKTEATERLSLMREEKHNLTSQIASKKSYLADLGKELEGHLDTISALEKELTKFSTSPDQIIEQLREDFVALMEQEADRSNHLTALTAEIENQRQELASKSAELAQLTSDREELADLTNQLKLRHEKAVQHVQELLQSYQQGTNDLAEKRKGYELLQSHMFETIDQIKTKEAREQSLLAIQKNHSQFYAGVKAVLQNAVAIGGVVGAVSEHISFSSTYQTAIETALGGASQHIIVEDEGAAKRAISYLKTHRSGRATFLPLTTIKAREMAVPHRQKLESSEGFIGLAHELSVYNQPLAHIFENLLGTVAVFETIDHATKAARQVNYQVRLVTLDGSEIRPGGSFAGGSNRQNNTTFIKPELEAIATELTELREILRQYEEDVANAKSHLSVAETDLAALKEAGETARLTEQKAQLEYDQAFNRLQQVNQLLDALLLSQKKEDAVSLEEQKYRIEKELAQIAENKQKVSEQLSQIKTDKDSITAKVASLNDLLSQARLDEREKASETKFETSNLERLCAEDAQLSKDIETLELWLASDVVETQTTQLPILEQQLDDARERKETNEQLTVRLRFELEDVEGSLDDIEEQLQKANTQNEGLIRHQAQLEGDINQLTEKLQGFARQLSEDYQMSFDEATEKAQAVSDMPKARHRLSELQRHIKALGPVNLEAVSQYDEVSERLHFLNGQRDDLVEAKNLLMNTIHDMDDEVKSRFKATFEAIRESFKQTFTQMFGGGSADLVLTEGDLLTAGVDISVQPPGKKIQSLNLMSGGEKALSALALLFAIIRVKTIPFVILDEVEAALDEANVKRFGDYLNRFDKDSQFIVVTHRKGTMAAADSIYGVTMQESGVSKIVSVKLKDAEELVT